MLAGRPLVSRDATGAVFFRGGKTLRVPMSMYAEHRAKLVAALAPFTPCGVALLQGGEAVSRHDTDHEELFRQESFFAYLFGVQEPGFFGAVELATGAATLFAPRLPEEYAVWMGRIPTPAELALKYGVESVLYVDELPAALGTAPVVHLLSGANSDSGASAKPASFAGLEGLPCELGVLHAALVACRSVKTAGELRLLRYVCALSSEAHISVMRQARPGMLEYQLESLFQHHCYMWGGARHVGYTSICACGPNAATLHYGHAGAPNDRELLASDIALLDMGAEYCCYGADITRSFPVSGTFSPDQALIYNAVLAAQDAVFAAIQPGVEWADMHRLAEKVILAALTAAGLLQGSAEAQAAAQLGAVFMPHGLGHMLGIDTHDVGGFINGRARLEGPGISKLRMNRVLEPGMVVTVEPGCYFIKPLLDAAKVNPAQAGLLCLDVLARFEDFGGVRLEDDVVVTATGMENLTNCPRTTAEVEAVMAGGAWPAP